MTCIRKSIVSTIKNLTDTDKILISIFIVITEISIVTCKVNGVSVDYYWMLNLGNYVKEYHTLSTTNIWVIHENFKIILQSWLSSIVVYGWYEIFRENISATVFLGYIYIVIHTVSAYKYCRLHTENKSLALVISSLCTIVAFGMLNARPSLISSTIFYIELTLLTHYYIRKDLSGKKLLIGLSLLSIFQVNWQAAAWAFLIVLELPFIAQVIIYRLGILKSDTQKSEYTTQLKYSLVSIIVIIVSGLINPYGYKSEIYLWLSRENFTINWYASLGECSPVQFISIDAIIIIISIYILIKAIKVKKVKPYEVFITLGTLFLAIRQQRQSYMIGYGVSSILLKMINLNSDTLKNHISKTKKQATVLIEYIQIFLTAFFTCAIIVVSSTNNTKEKLGSLVEHLDSDVEANNLDKSELKILNDIGSSAYLQFNGYKTYEENRIESLSKYITGQTPRNNNDKQWSVMEEYINIGFSSVDVKYYNNFFNYYDFDYAVLGNTNFLLYIQCHPEDWQEIDIEDNESDYRLFKRIRN